MKSPKSVNMEKKTKSSNDIEDLNFTLKQIQARNNEILQEMKRDGKMFKIIAQSSSSSSSDDDASQQPTAVTSQKVKQVKKKQFVNEYKDIIENAKAEKKKKDLEKVRQMEEIKLSQYRSNSLKQNNGNILKHQVEQSIDTDIFSLKSQIKSFDKIESNLSPNRSKNSNIFNQSIFLKIQKINSSNKDYGTKNNFRPVRDNEKYYIDKNEYQIQQNKKKNIQIKNDETKQIEELKYTKKVQSLLQQKQKLKNKLEQLQNLQLQVNETNVEQKVTQFLISSNIKSSHEHEILQFNQSSLQKMKQQLQISINNYLNKILMKNKKKAEQTYRLVLDPTIQMIKEELSVDESKSTKSHVLSKSNDELNEFDIDEENESQESSEFIPQSDFLKEQEEILQLSEKIENKDSDIKEIKEQVKSSIINVQNKIKNIDMQIQEIHKIQQERKKESSQKSFESSDEILSHKNDVDEFIKVSEHSEVASDDKNSSQSRNSIDSLNSYVNKSSLNKYGELIHYLPAQKAQIQNVKINEKKIKIKTIQQKKFKALQESIMKIQNDFQNDRIDLAYYEGEKILDEMKKRENETVTSLLNTVKHKQKQKHLKIAENIYNENELSQIRQQKFSLLKQHYDEISSQKWKIGQLLQHSFIQISNKQHISPNQIKINNQNVSKQKNANAFSTKNKQDQKDLEILNILDQKEESFRAILHNNEVFQNVEALKGDFENQNSTELQSPLIIFLSLLNQSNIKVNPKNMGFMHKKNKDIIDLQYFYMAKEYLEPFVNSLRICQYVKQIILRRCSLDTDSSSQIFLNLPNCLEYFDISDNSNIGFKSMINLQKFVVSNQNIFPSLLSLRLENWADSISQILSKEECNIQILFLHWNHIGPKGGLSIAESLKINASLQILDLSFCSMGFQKKYVPYQEQFAKLDETQNTNIAGLFAQAMSEKKQKLKISQSQEKLQVQEQQPKQEHIDEQNNEIDNQKIQENLIAEIAKKQEEELMMSGIPPRKKVAQLEMFSAQAWSEAFKKNKYLIHLDLSHNGFDSRELQIISEGLNQNHEILGIHLNGNEGEVDVEGFVKEFDLLGSDHLEDIKKHQVLTRIRNDLQMGKIRDQCKLKLKTASNCWICEGWSEFQFEFRPNRFIDMMEGDTVKIHLSIDNYEGQLLDYEDEEVEITQPISNFIDNNFSKAKKQAPVTAIKQIKKQQVFKTRRMLPPGPIFYYFTVNGEPFINDSQQSLNIKGNKKRIDFSQVDQNIKLELQKLKVPKTNFIQNILQSNEIITESYLAKLIAKPRPPPLVIASRMNLKTPWDFYKSIFKTYKPDTDKIIDECFEYDWPNTKIEKIIKDEHQIEQIRDYIKSIYKYLRQAYKHYSGVMPFGRLTCITTPTITEMLYNCGDFIDNKSIKLADIDLQVIACNGGKKSTSFLDPEKALVRYQFMEVLVRLAIDKYYKTNLAQSVFHAVEMAFQHNFLPHFKSFDCHEFRKNQLWKEEIHILLTRFEKGLHEVYKKYSGRHQHPNQKPAMSLDEFYDMMTHSQLLDENFHQRDVGIFFSLSMMTNKQENESDKHLQMTFVEFLELLGRCADKFELEKLEDFFPEYKSKHPKRLDKKLESLCLVIMNNILNPKQYLQIFSKYKETVDAEVSNPKETKFKIK